MAPRKTSSENRRDGADASRLEVTAASRAEVDMVIEGADQTARIYRNRNVLVHGFMDVFGFWVDVVSSAQAQHSISAGGGTGVSSLRMVMRCPQAR